MFQLKPNRFILSLFTRCMSQDRRVRLQRDGLSIIEVLTALSVAIIGVFGVMALIPFAIRQSTIGLDLDNANLFGRNALEKFEAYNYSKPFEDTSFYPEEIPGQMPWLIPSIPVFVDPVMNASLGANDPRLEPVLSRFDVFPNRASNGAHRFIDNGVDPFLTTAQSAYYGPQVRYIDPEGFGHMNPDGTRIFSFPTNFVDLSTYPGTLPADRDGDMRADFPYLIRSATLANIASLPTEVDDTRIPTGLSASEVFRLCRDGDRIGFTENESDDAVAGEPLQQDFFEDSNGNRVKRLSFGRVSWTALAEPLKDPLKVRKPAGWDPAILPLRPADPPSDVTGYRVSFLIHKDRKLDEVDNRDAGSDPVPTAEDELGRMVYAPVARTTLADARNVDTDPLANPDFLNSGFDPSVNRITLTRFTSEEQAELFDETFEKHEWVMLINHKPLVSYGSVPFQPQPIPLVPRLPPVPIYDDGRFVGFEPLSADELGFNTQIGFFRIVSSQNGYSDIAADRINPTLTVSGGKFDFFYSDIPGTQTYVVHLKNVINVFEKTFTLDE